MTMFPSPSLDRDRLDWAEHIMDMSPVERHGGCWVKREDLFAPLGAGGINGSKLRGCILMMNRRFNSGAELVITGASVRSPQHSMTAAVANHLGMSTLHIIGATNDRAAMSNEQVRMAAWFGAKFDIVPVAYNPQLQSRVAQLMSGYEPMMARAGVSAVMPYGISPQGAEEVLEFHHMGGAQVRNLPDVDTLVIPAGSCNTLASILYGLQVHETPASLKRVVTVGIGPDRLKWLWQRLGDLGVRDGYRYHAPAHRALAKPPTARNYLEIVHLDPHGEGFCTYGQSMPEKLGDIVLHPTYEGKVKRYLDRNYPELLGDRACFWIVGGPASLQAMVPYCGELALPPMHLPMWENPGE